MTESIKEQKTPRAAMLTVMVAACLSIAALVSLNCASQFAAPTSGDYTQPAQLAELENRSVKESSGVAASRRDPNVLWTHNDSGDGPLVYAFNRQGKHLGVWRVAGAEAQDWEDCAIGPGSAAKQSYLYLGDIGDNSKKREQIIIYRIVEPTVTPDDAASTDKAPRMSAPADVIRLKYPDGAHDAETLMVHPATGDLYIVTKVRGAAAGVYKISAPLPATGVATLSRVGEVSFPNPFIGFLTGGDISPDGRRVILCDYLGACELVLPDKKGVAFDEIWKQPLVSVSIGSRRQGEAVCYRADGLALLATSEGSPCPLIEILRTPKK